MTERRPDRMTTDASSDDTGLLSVGAVLAALLRARWLIVGITAAGIAFALFSALTRKPSYTAEFSFIPQLAQDQGRSGLASIAGQFGINVGGLAGGAPPPQLYADLLETRAVLGAVATDTVTGAKGERLTIPQFLMIEGSSPELVLEQSIRKLRDAVVSTSVAARTTNAVVVRARTGSPRASLEIAERLLRGLNDFNRQTRQSQAREERRFALERLNTVRRSLSAVEDSLHRFLQGNRQFGSASALRFEQDRLESEVTLQRDLVRGLSQQAEEASLREVRDTPVITLIERPTLPVIRDSMGRVRTLFMWTLGSFFFAVTLVLAREGWRRQRSTEARDPGYQELLAEWRRFRGKPAG